jgi:cobalt-zinc-cadmium efflux system protein
MSERISILLSNKKGGFKLLLAFIINLLITGVEFIGGLVSGSLSLLSDALHNLGDAVAILLAYLAKRIGQRDCTNDKTFGFRRIEILTALFNAVVLIAICLFLIFEAYERLLHPEPVKGFIMMAIATFGLIANLASVLFLRKEKEDDLNTKAAYLHLLGDTFSSGAVILGGILIYFFAWYWVDAVITFIVSLYIVKEAYVVLKQTINILMQSTPTYLDLEGVKKEIEKIQEVSNIHHVHAWNLTDNAVFLEGHVSLRHDLRISETEMLKEKIETLLKNEFSIYHVNLQFEFGCGCQKDMIYSREEYQ